MNAEWKVRLPKYDELTLPLLQLAGDGQIYDLRGAVEQLAEITQISEEQREEMLPSGKQRRFDNRVHWACTYLKQAGLLESAGWGKFRITERGVDVLQAEPAHINRRFLMQFPEFAAFQQRERPGKSGYADRDEFGVDLTPHDLIETAYLSVQQDLADELLDIILASPPSFFERLVLDVLVAMGYGSSLENAAAAIGKSGDGGIDGYIHEDKLGLETVYVQAKCWARNRPVGRPEIQAFVGSLLGTGGSKGVFITTSRFTQEATAYAEHMQHCKLVLINGEQLTQLMIDYNVGVSIERQYIVKTIDRDYFHLD